MARHLPWSTRLSIAPQGVEQSHPVVVKNIAALIPRILLVPGLKCKWSVNEIQIQILQSESIQTGLEGRLHALGPVIGVPQLCGHKDFFACDPSGGEVCLQRLAYLALVPVSFRATLRPASPPEVKKLDARPQKKTWGLPETAHGICNGCDIIITIRVFERSRLHLDGFPAGKGCPV
jgi:hypothetical protein